MVPNLFMPGAAKCGTTSLFAILCQHPQIHATRVKEPNFFNWPYQVVRNPFEYFRLFDSPKRYRLDASVGYLSNPNTPAVLHGLFPNARFVISLRHPKARAYSLYRFMRHLKGEDLPTFSDALKAEPHRFASPEFLSCCSWTPWAYMYCRSSFYDEQLRRYFALFPRTQFHIITLAELSKDPVATTQEILRFLDLDPAPAADFNYEIKNRREDAVAAYDAECDSIMSAAFAGLTERTDRIIGRELDWSL